MGSEPVLGYDDIEHASLTDVGLRRSHNQDAHAVLLAADAEQWQKRGHLFLVADGMGAHAVGELASQLAATTIPHTYHKQAAEEGCGAALRKAFIEANTTIHTRGQQNREFQGMGTTGSALLIRPDGAWIGHVGDSRVYRIRDGQIEQLSFDHSLVWELARRKGVDPDGLEGVPTNVIVRSLGPEPLVQVDIEGPHPLHPGDVFLLCSDGLSGQVTDPEIGAVAGTLPPAEACQFLVALANLRGGPDNITVLVVRTGEAGAGAAPPPRPPRPRTPWHQRLPFRRPLATLVVGLLLAAGAVNLSVSEFPLAAVPVSVLSILCLLMGLVGLAVKSWQERGGRGQAESRPRLHVYRHAPCRIERPLLDQIIKLEGALSHQVRDKQLEADWDLHQQHRRQAEQHAAAGDLAAAFREYCRALLPLTEALQHHRGEVFLPLWETKKTKVVKPEGDEKGKG